MLFKVMTIDCEPEDLNGDTEMFERIHFSIKNSKRLDLWIGTEHFQFADQQMLHPAKLTLSPVEIQLNLMQYRKEVTTKNDLMETQPFKRLDNIRKVEGKNKLHMAVLDLIRQTDKRVIIFDPFEYDDLSGFHNNNYLMAQLQIVAGNNVVTTQMGLLDIPWDYNYSIYIVNNQSQVISVDLQDQSPLNISRQIRREHNLFKLWRSGGLGDQFL